MAATRQSAGGQRVTGKSQYRGALGALAVGKLRREREHAALRVLTDFGPPTPLRPELGARRVAVVTLGSEYHHIALKNACNRTNDSPSARRVPS